MWYCVGVCGRKWRVNFLQRLLVCLFCTLSKYFPHTKPNKSHAKCTSCVTSYESFRVIFEVCVKMQQKRSV